MTVYVSLPQVPLTLKYEEGLDQVVQHFQQMVTDRSVHRYEWADGQAIVINFGVVQSMTFSEGHRSLEVSELHRGVVAMVDTE
jgi:hypothetical protein